MILKASLFVLPLIIQSTFGNPECPSGYEQVGDLTADIGGCGLEGCDARYQNNYINMVSCEQACDARSDCASFSWAPMNDDGNHLDKTVCTLYNTFVRNQLWGNGQQILCKKTTDTPVCPAGFEQVGGYRADIGGCGLEGCAARYQDNYPDLRSCSSACKRRSDCESFSWAPLADDVNHAGVSVCTLYNTAAQNQEWGHGKQILCRKVCDVQTSTITAYMSGDPHFRNFNGVGQHYQGNVFKRGKRMDGRGRDVQYYLMTSCYDSDAIDQPFSMIGSFTQYYHHNLALVQYIVLVLYQPGETFYVFLSGGVAGHGDIPPLGQYYVESEGATSWIEENIDNGITAHNIDIGVEASIGDKFTMIRTGNYNHFWTTLTDTETGCTLTFEIRLEGHGNTFRWHWVQVLVPTCYLCSNCGMLGDFQTPAYQGELIGCDGNRVPFYAPWGPQSGNYDPAGWTYEKDYFEENCGLTPDKIELPPAPECPSELQDEVNLACQSARDEQEVCCRNLGGGICTSLQFDCEIDVCLMANDGLGTVDELVQSQYTQEIEDNCERTGAFGPVPKLLYDFQDNSLGERMTGDPKYNLFVDTNSDNNAQVVNGVLRCDGAGDYVLSEHNLDFEVGSHSLEVLIALDNLGSVGGGSIAIDSNYDANGGYTHNKFDSIVYNELNNKKWFLGSEYFKRTDKSGGSTVETQAGQYIQLVAVYDVENNVAKLYRNGVEEQNYTPAGFFTAAADSGVRMMFCQRHLHAGAGDFAGRIRYGAYYDRALGADEVSSLYENGIAVVGGSRFEVIGDELKPNVPLTSGQALRSINGQYVAVMQDDGNFVVYDDNAVAIFNTGTHVVGGSENFAILQETDGNFVVYGIDGSVKWASYAGSDDDDPAFMIMRDDGNLAAYKQTASGIKPYYGTKGSNFASKSNGFLSFIGGNNDNGTMTESSTMMTYLMYFIGLLLITNIVCFAIYCMKKKGGNKTRRYKVVSVDSTDIDSDAEEISLK